MGMTIDLAMNNLSGILTEATENDNSVCYVTEDDAETLRVAIETMCKYQKIEQIMKSKKMDALNIGLLIPKDMACVLHEIREVVEDENVD